MNKSDKIIVAVLALLLCGWFYVSRQEAKKRAAFYEEHPELVQQTQSASAAEPAPTAGQPAAEPAGPTAGTAPEMRAASAAEELPAVSAEPEKTVVVSNDAAEFEFTSKGGALKRVTLKKFRETRDGDDPVSFDFSDRPALAIEGIAGLDSRSDFEISEIEGGVAVKAVSAKGLTFERTVLCTNGYLLAVSDVIRNVSGETVETAGSGIALGAMRGIGATAKDMDLGVDLRTGAGRGSTLEQNLAKSFGKGLPSFAAMFGTASGGCKSSPVSPTAPMNASAKCDTPVDWVALRERFFVEILTPAVPGTGVETRLVRKATPAGAMLALDSVGATLECGARTFAPGSELASSYSLYVGPRKLSELRAISPTHRDVMRFGTWSFFCRILLDFLNFIHDTLRVGYGWAIILLTILVRLVLFPLNRKSTENMKKMSAIQPKIKELQAKFKDDPRKLQQEQMKLYAENHVNPMSSSLPMLIQPPIFIALFTVLRSCVELRFSEFLWISDLSEPENCFREFLVAHGIPFGVNFLPIAMAVTMTLQSRLTPSAGDAQQQKMMSLMMPVMMLFICYNFASALGLYWVVSQALAIIGLWRAKRKGDQAKA